MGENREELGVDLNSLTHDPGTPLCSQLGTSKEQFDQTQPVTPATVSTWDDRDDAGEIMGKVNQI